MEIIFESSNIYFIKITKSLLQDYLDMVNDIGNVGRMIGRIEIISEEDELKWIDEKLSTNAPIYSMIEKKSGNFIGCIEIMDMTDNEGELGIAITKKMQNKGYGTEAINCLINYAFNKFNLNRLFLKVFPNNERAIHVYNKCGFIEYERNDDHIYMEINK